MPEYLYREGEAKTFMEREHAEAILRHEGRMPRKTELCDMSCSFSFCCANYKENEMCQGFHILSNGELERHINDNILIDEFDRLGVERYIQMIQQTDSMQIKNQLLPTVYRYLKPHEKKEKTKLITMIGFDRVIIHEDGTTELFIPEKKQPKIPDPELPPYKLDMMGRNQNRIMKRREEK